MKYIIILDRLISKHVKVILNDGLDLSHLKPWDLIVYKSDDEDDLKLGLYVGFDVPTEINGKFIRVLESKEKEKFDENQKKALKHFESFRHKFKKNFPESIPVTARINLDGNIIYFYFYSELRFQFAEFVREFRKEVGMHFFLYQVGARDMIRLHPDSRIRLAACGCGLMGCAGLGQLPSIEMENVVLQNLEGRDVEKLKGRCGKLKCSLIFEKDVYLGESKKFPKKGETIKLNDKDCVCSSYNIMNGDIFGRTSEGEYVRSNISERKNTNNLDA